MVDSAPTAKPQDSLVTKQQVIDAYLYFLGREPENEAAIAAKLKVPSLDELRRAFIESREFEGICGLQLEKHLPSLALPKLRIDTDANPEEIQRLFERIRTEWEDFGATEPHWSVLAQPEFKKETFESHRKGFFDSGAEVRAIIEQFCERLSVEPRRFRSCFELGCGVGRTTMHLAEIFPLVIAADISRSYLSLCRGELQRTGQQNVELHHLPDVDRLSSLPPYDFFCSFLVLQHNPPPLMKLLLERILGKLDRGGAGVFQVMTYHAGYRFDLEDFLAYPPALHMEMHVLPQSAVFATVAVAGCRVFEVREDSFAAYRSPDILSNTFFVEKP